MRKEFTKADLKDGMVVEYRSGGKRLVLEGQLLGIHGHHDLEDYTEDMKCRSCNDSDIVKVYQTNNVRILNDIFQKDFLKLIWERDATKHMTAKEMRQKLEELTGEKIEVEPSREEMMGKCYMHCCNNDCISGCILMDSRSCVFARYSDEQLKEAYKKVIANGK